LLKPPLRKWNTRVVIGAEASEGRLVAQGYEVEGVTTAPATAPLELTA
jgi:hypothetical protein